MKTVTYDETQWKLVPVVPTGAMMDAGLYQGSEDLSWADLHSAWTDMLAAAPQPPAQHPTSAPDSDAEREAFEEWYEERYPSNPSPARDGDGYLFPDEQSKWEAWQARAAIAAKEQHP